ncbi:head-tail connector protein [Mesorhizobium sp.]|uniref:head-tail connector protein n=1 Tax=Mesorhizobium sp. TaxID=1871066 RepID=UPI000FEA5278|nr:head-tail connector protein [Mesorhizobium sp.]RWK12530.1 MAG: hypothetical protein EOR39_02725 [Mesorhizobium sp.]
MNWPTATSNYRWGAPLAPVRTVAPAEAPVSLDEMKLHLHAGDDEDTLIQAYIDAATAHLDGYTGIIGRALVTQTWQQDFSGFSHSLRLPLGPLESVSSVTYYDGSNVQQTLATSVYDKFTDALGPHVGLKPGQSWPSTYTRPDAVRVTFVAGEDVADVPAPIKVAIMLLAANWYENRESVTLGSIPSEMPMGVAALIAPYRRVGV